MTPAVDSRRCTCTLIQGRQYGRLARSFTYGSDNGYDGNRGGWGSTVEEGH